MTVAALAGAAIRIAANAATPRTFKRLNIRVLPIKSVPGCRFPCANGIRFDALSLSNHPAKRALVNSLTVP